MAGKPARKKRQRQIDRIKANIAEAGADLPYGRAEDVSTDPHARARYCAEIMAADHWAFLETRQRLSKAWDVGDAAIRRYAAEAKALLAIDATDLEMLRRQSMRAMVRIAQKAEEAVSKATGLPSWRDVIEAYRYRDELAEKLAPPDVAPVNAPPRIEVVVIGDAQSADADAKSLAETDSDKPENHEKP